MNPIPWSTAPSETWWLEGIRHQVVYDAAGQPVAYSYPGAAEMIVQAVNAMYAAEPTPRSTDGPHRLSIVPDPLAYECIDCGERFDLPMRYEMGDDHETVCKPREGMR